MTSRVALIAAVLAASVLTVAAWWFRAPAVSSSALGLALGGLGDLLSALSLNKAVFSRISEGQRPSRWQFPAYFVIRHFVLFALVCVALLVAGLPAIPFLCAFAGYHTLRLGLMLFRPRQYAAWVAGVQRSS